MLDDLVGVIETLKSRIEAHGAGLHANETRTRMSLIGPLLNTLGWDVADPVLVTAEYDVNGKRADYALLGSDGKPVVFLEAKRLGESLSNHHSQVVAYASELGIRYPALTNGNDWQVYDNSKMVPIEERRILNVSLTQDPAAQCALQLLLLWRSNMAESQPVPPPRPIVEAEEVRKESPVASIVDKGPDRQEPEDNGNWVSLKDFSATSGTAAPAKVRFPSGKDRSVKNWRYLYVVVAEWLVQEGALTEGECPISVGSRKGYYLVNSQPRHPNGKDFLSPYELSNGLFLPAHISAKAAVARCKALMKHFSKDLSRVRLQVS